LALSQCMIFWCGVMVLLAPSWLEHHQCYIKQLEPGDCVPVLPLPVQHSMQRCSVKGKLYLAEAVQSNRPQAPLFRLEHLPGACVIKVPIHYVQLRFKAACMQLHVHTTSSAFRLSLVLTANCSCLLPLPSTTGSPHDHLVQEGLSVKLA